MKSLALGDARSAAAFGFFALAAASLLSPSSVSSQAPPVAAPTAAKTADGWEIAIAPRAGFFLPQRSESGVVPRRPTGGFEVMARRKGSWYGARALFERSASWSPRTDLAAQVLQGPDASLVGSEDPQAFFETVVLDAVAFAPGLDGARPYVFTGYGSKVIGATEEAGILPYSLVAAERAPAWHAGFGIEAPLGQGGAVVFELGDYYGRNGGPDAVHDMHITLMARLADVGGLVRKLGLNDEPDDQVRRHGR